jgi:glucose-1-phosphate adenylyltransferase
MQLANLLKSTLTMILAGGQGERLYPLTKERAKPAVPFAGKYRIIDFTLSNCANSGLKRIYVLTQYKSFALDRHMKLGWNIFSSPLGECLYTIPPQFRTGRRWYEGTADAVYQNIYTLEHERPDRVLMLSGDHVYKMDYSEMIEAHVRTGALVTVGAAECPKAAATRMGVMAVDKENRVVEFQEKVADPRPIPGRPDVCLANMGVYVFETSALVRAISEDARSDTAHDFGRNILPNLVPTEKVFAHPFRDPCQPESHYWRDVGTLDSYYEASMDLVKPTPQFDLYDPHWPIRSYMEPRPPAKLIFADEEGGRLGQALDSLLCNGSIVSGGQVERCILSPDVRIRSYSRVEDSILLDQVEVGRHAKIRRTIIDKYVTIPPEFEIGYDLEADAKRFTVTQSGLVVIPRGTVIS